jgi:hypothetical protein
MDFVNRCITHGVLLGIVACSNAAPPRVTDALPPGTPQAKLASAPQTALIALTLHPDGAVELISITRKPIPFRGRQLVAFDAARHDPVGQAPLPTGGPDSRPAGPGRLGVEGGPAGGATQSISAPEHGVPAGHVLVVRAAPLGTPLVVPLELGAPSEGGGDVADRWRDEVVLVRAPSFGDGTHYTLVRERLGAVERLAERTEGR